MKLKDIITDYKNKTGVNDSEIARRLGISRSTTARWSKGLVQRLSKEDMEKLSMLVGYNVEPHLRGMDISLKLPVLGYAKAGYDLFAEENYLGEEDASMDEKKNGDYFLRVEGNSMTGVGIMDGSYVLVRKTNQIQNGAIGVVLINDEVTIKRVFQKNHMLILEAANPDVENRYFTAKEVKEIPVQIIGQVISSKTYF